MWLREQPSTVPSQATSVHTWSLRKRSEMTDLVPELTSYSERHLCSDLASVVSAVMAWSKLEIERVRLFRHEAEVT